MYVKLKKLQAAGLLDPEWQTVSTVHLIALATILNGRFLELAYLALTAERRADAEIWTILTGPRRLRKTHRELAEIIRRSARAFELVPELDENQQRQERLRREINIRAALENPAMVGMLVAHSASPKIEANKAKEILESGLGIRSLDDDLKQIALAGSSPDDGDKLDQLKLQTEHDGGGALAAFHKQEKLALEATLANLPPNLVPPAAKNLVPQVEPSSTRARLYRYAYILVSRLNLVFGTDSWSLPNAARQAWRSEDEKQEAKKRGGHGAHKTAEARRADQPARAIVEVSLDHRAGEPTSDGDLPHSRDALERQILTLDGTPKETRTPEVNVLEHEERLRRDADLERYRRLAETKGAEAKRLLETYMEVGTVKEAAARMGISRQTAHKHLRDLKEILRNNR